MESDVGHRAFSLGQWACSVGNILLLTLYTIKHFLVNYDDTKFVFFKGIFYIIISFSWTAYHGSIGGTDKIFQA